MCGDIPGRSSMVVGGWGRVGIAPMGRVAEAGGLQWLALVETWVVGLVAWIVGLILICGNGIWCLLAVVFGNFWR